MKTKVLVLPACLVVLFLPHFLFSADTISIGDSENKVISVLGQPRGKMQIGKAVVYYYTNGRVTLVDGKVNKTDFTGGMPSQKKADNKPQPITDKSFLALCEAVTNPVECTVGEAQNVLENAKNATVLITGSISTGMTSKGTGFFVSPDGYIVTCYHVIGGCTHLEVKTFDGQTFTVNEVVHYSHVYDLALLKVAGGPFAHINMRKDKDVRQSEKVFTIGHPHKSTWLFVEGVITAAKPQQVRGREEIQFAIDTSPGNSGGALLDRFGRLYAVMSYHRFELYEELSQQLGVPVLDPSPAHNFGISANTVIEFILESANRQASPLSSVVEFNDHLVLLERTLYIFRTFDYLNSMPVSLNLKQDQLPPSKNQAAQDAGKPAASPPTEYVFLYHPNTLAVFKDMVKRLNSIKEVKDDLARIDNRNLNEAGLFVNKLVDAATARIETFMSWHGKKIDQLKTDKDFTNIFPDREMHWGLYFLRRAMQDYKMDVIRPDDFEKLNKLLVTYPEKDEYGFYYPH